MAKSTQLVTTYYKISRYLNSEKNRIDMLIKIFSDQDEQEKYIWNNDPKIQFQHETSGIRLNLIAWPRNQCMRKPRFVLIFVVPCL